MSSERLMATTQEAAIESDAVSDVDSANSQGIAPLPYPSAGQAYLTVGLITLAYIFAFVDRIALSLVLDPIREDLGLNDTQVSALAGFAFVICYVIFAFPFGRWVDKRARPGALTLGITVWSAAMVACGFATSFWQLFVGRMLVGTGEAAVNPVAYSTIPDSFPPERRSSAMAVFASGSTIGGGLAVYLGSLILGWAERVQPVLPVVGALAPWQLLFIGLGLPGLLVAILIHFTLRDPPRRVTVATDTSVRSVVDYFTAHRGLFAMMFIGFSGFAIINYSFMVWGPTYFMRVHQLNISQVGLLMGLGFAVFGTLGVLLGGLWADRARRFGHIDAPVRIAIRIAMIQAPFFLVAYLSPNPVVAVVFFCGGMFSAAMIGGLQGAMVQSLTPNRMRGQASAVFLTVVNVIGLGLAPMITAIMTDYVFGDPAQIGKSLATTIAFATAMILVLLISGQQRARQRATEVLDA
jgi:MFS family permease